MPFAPHLRLTARGTLYALEDFSFGVNMTAVGVDSAAFLDGNVDDLAADVSAFFARPATGIRSSAVLTEVKLASIGADGKYTRDPAIRDVNVPGAGAGNGLYPPQISLAVSLVTGQRGPRGKGRFYLPLPSVPLFDAGRMALPAVQAVRDSCKTFLDALNNSPGTDLQDRRVCVASSFGENYEVTGVRVGRALDTIRSRREKLDEAYTEVADVG